VTADQPDFEEMEDEGLLSGSMGDGPSKIRMGELVKKYLQAQTLEVLGEDDLEDAVTRYVDKDDTDAIKEYAALRCCAIMRAQADDPRSGTTAS